MYSEIMQSMKNARKEFLLGEII